MEETFVPFRGIKNDLKGRLLCYKQDWTGGFHAGIRFVTPVGYLQSQMCAVYPIVARQSACIDHYLNSYINYNNTVCRYYFLSNLSYQSYHHYFFHVGSQLQQHIYSLLQQFQSYLLGNNQSEIQVRSMLYIAIILLLILQWSSANNSVFIAFFLFLFFFLKTYCRWNFNCSANSGINSTLRHHPFNCWRATPAHTGGC